MTARILQGDVLDRLRELPDESVACVVTSPPYWGLRDYQIPASIWGGDADCAHAWDMRSMAAEVGKGNWSQGVNGRGELQDGGASAKREPMRSSVETGYCRKCNAWMGCLGFQPTPKMFIDHVVTVFREIRRVLRKDGTAWVNMGDSYVGYHGNRKVPDSDAPSNKPSYIENMRASTVGMDGLKPKDLVGIPWRLAFALQADGWWLRQDIIWAKPNPMPESIIDRCTKSHEYIFLLTKSERYYYDAEAIAEDCVSDHLPGMISEDKTTAMYKSGHEYFRTRQGLLAHAKKQKSKVPGGWMVGPGAHGTIHSQGRTEATYVEAEPKTKRNKRSVWTVATQPFSEAHFATFPEELITPCILAGSAEGGTVLDPFSGSGTTGVVALRYHRNYIGIELSAEYVAMSERRIHADAPLFNRVEVTA